MCQEYSLPQDAIVRFDAPKEDEKEQAWDPYGLSGVDMSAYGLVDAPKVCGRSE